MNRFDGRIRNLFFCFVLIGIPVQTWAVTPMAYFNNLVAGADPGYRDGSFIQAQFNDLAGIALDESGQKLYAADSGNNRIRVIDLAGQNTVDTLAGTGAAGSLDGPLEKATFNRPSGLAYLSPGRLAVFEAGNIRLIDLKTKLVSTAARGLLIWDMVYRPQDESLYFSDLNNKSLCRLDLKSLAVSVVFSNSKEIPFPYALCLKGDGFYVADRNSSKVYEVNFVDGKTPERQEAIFKEVGQGDRIAELAVSDGSLYAIQAGKSALVRLGPAGVNPVHLATAWGFFADADHAGVQNLLNFQENQKYGFALSPMESRKFYISTSSNIMSVKDYHFDQKWVVSAEDQEQGHLTDFDYPAGKPSGTFRILIAGDERTASAPRDKADTGDKADKGSGTFRTDTFPKQLEFFLNAESSLRNAGTHFEVLTLTHPDKNFSDSLDQEITVLAKKYDVDLVLCLAGKYEAKKEPGDSILSGLRLLSQRIQALKTSVETAPQLGFFYVPSPSWNNDEAESAWKTLCAQNHFLFIDLTEPFNGLKIGYFPAIQKGDNPGYTAYGSELVAHLLSRYLENNRVIPFEPSKK